LEHHQNNEAEPREETEEEHAVRLRKISEEVKADIKAGRYRHGQLRPDISAKKSIKFLDTPRSTIYEDMIRMQEKMMREMLYGVESHVAYPRHLDDIPVTPSKSSHDLFMLSEEDLRRLGTAMYRTVTGRFERKSHHEYYGILDECHHIKKWDWNQISKPKPPKEERDWERTMFKQDEKSSTPSDATRAKLRAKRKKRK
jgi:hypothetical protein